MPVVVTWNGSDVPQELQALPAGRYALEPVDDIPELSANEDAGIQAALEALRRGEGVSSADVRRRLDAVLKR